MINALMTAGGARSIAEGCRQEYLSGCTCVTNGRLIRQGTNFTFFDCNSDTTFASNFITDFTKSTNPSTAAEKVDNHNIDVGLKVSTLLYSDVLLSLVLDIFRLQTRLS